MIEEELSRKRGGGGLLFLFSYGAGISLYYGKRFGSTPLIIRNLIN